MTKKRILTLVTGGFDPLHSGHIAYFEQARELTNYLVVGLNTEEWLTKKKGQYFQSWKERAEIIRHLDMVDAVITVEDDEHGSACNAISACLEIAQTVVLPMVEIVDQIIHLRQISSVTIRELKWSSVSVEPIRRTVVHGCCITTLKDRENW